MDSDHKLLCLLSTLRSMFSYDGRLGVGGTGRGGKVGHGHLVDSGRKTKTPEEIDEELTVQARREIAPRLVYLWKKYNDVERLPLKRIERDHVVANIYRAASEMIFEWKIRHKVLEDKWTKIQMEWNKRRDTVQKCKTENQTLQKQIKTLKEDITKGPKRWNGTHEKTFEELNNEKQKMKQDLETKTELLEENKRTILKTDTTDPDQYFSRAFIKCRQALKEFEDNLLAKEKWIKIQTDQAKKDEGWCIYSDMEERLYTLKKIHDDMKRVELDDIQNGRAKLRQND